MDVYMDVNSLSILTNLTRCVMCNGLANNLISTIDIYDKLVIAWEKIKNKSISNGTSCCCKRKK